MDPHLNIVQPPKKRPYTASEKERIKKVRRVGACSKCNRGKRRVGEPMTQPSRTRLIAAKCTHVALGDHVATGPGSGACQLPSTSVPDVSHGTPELVNATEDVQPTPGGDYADPRTPASQDSWLISVANPNQGFHPQVFINPDLGNPWAESPSNTTGPADHEFGTFLWLFDCLTNDVT